MILKNIFNTAFFVLLPLSLFGWEITRVICVMIGGSTYYLASQITNQRIKYYVYGALAFLFVVIFAGLGDIAFYTDPNFASGTDLSVLVFDSFYILTGFAMGIGYELLISCEAENTDPNLTCFVRLAAIALIHVFFILSQTIKANVAFSNIALLNMSSYFAVFISFFFALAYLYNRSCNVVYTYSRAVNNSAHAPEITPDVTVSTPETEQPAEQESNYDDSLDISDEFLLEQWNKLVRPYYARITAFKLDKVIREIFIIFSTVGQNVPSVHGMDKTRLELPDSDFTLLADITLIDHTFRVADLCLDRVKSQHEDTQEFIWPFLLLISIGHDISKIPHLCEEYSTKDHGVNSANFIGSLFRKLSPEFKRNVLEPIIGVIRDHHKKFDKGKWSEKPDENLKILMACDQEAREIEKDGVRGGLFKVQPKAVNQQKNNQSSPKPPHENVASSPPTVNTLETVEADDIVGALVEEFTKKGRNNTREIIYIYELNKQFTKEVIDYLEQNYLNKLVNKGFYALSQKDGFVYCWTDTIYDLISILAEKKGSTSNFLFVEQYKYSVLMSFYRVLKALDFAPSDTVVNSERYFANSFTFFNPITEKESHSFYMLIRAEAFSADLKTMEETRFDKPELANIVMKKKDWKKRG